MTSPREGRITVPVIRSLKGRRRIAALTAVDMPTARWCDEAGIDVVLVGDSLGMVSLGLPDTSGVTMEHLLTATAAARRGLVSPAPPLLVADLPLRGFDAPVENARALVAAGADAVKVECHETGAGALGSIVAAGVPVMAHVGLLPQTVRERKGYALKGVEAEEAAGIEKVAKRAEEDGAFACVIEKVPRSLGRRLTGALAIPTIGIGAGVDCDGQILVIYDLLGVFDDFKPRFARRYLEIGREARSAVGRYVADVREGVFPSPGESFE